MTMTIIAILRIAAAVALTDEVLRVGAHRKCDAAALNVAN